MSEIYRRTIWNIYLNEYFKIILIFYLISSLSLVVYSRILDLHEWIMHGRAFIVLWTTKLMTCKFIEHCRWGVPLSFLNWNNVIRCIVYFFEKSQVLGTLSPTLLTFEKISWICLYQFWIQFFFQLTWDLKLRNRYRIGFPKHLFYTGSFIGMDPIWSHWRERFRF